MVKFSIWRWREIPSDHPGQKFVMQSAAARSARSWSPKASAAYARSSWATDPQALERALHERFPQTDLAACGSDFAPILAEVVAFIETPDTQLDLPLDIHGTEFQHKVWQALREIPRGQTATYGEIARHIGSPRSARAVGQACADNPLAIIIPCHRAVHSDGGLAGYRWGIERKRALQEMEK